MHQVCFDQPHQNMLLSLLQEEKAIEILYFLPDLILTEMLILFDNYKLFQLFTSLVRIPTSTGRTILAQKSSSEEKTITNTSQGT